MNLRYNPHAMARAARAWGGEGGMAAGDRRSSGAAPDHEAGAELTTTRGAHGESGKQVRAPASEGGDPGRDGRAGFASGKPPSALAADLAWRARLWRADGRPGGAGKAADPATTWRDPLGVPLAVAPPLLEEYGVDAARLAVLTAGGGTPGLDLLDSAYRWLAGVDEALAGTASAEEEPVGSDGIAGPPEGQERGPPADHGERRPALVPGGSPPGGGEEGGPGAGAEAAAAPPRGRGFPARAVDPWLVAAGEMADHGPGRGRWYPALAALRKAWKLAPPVPTAVAGMWVLPLVLLFPFAPVLARWWLERKGAWPPPPVARLTAGLRDVTGRQAVRVALERGGWAWVAVDAARFGADPAGVMATIPWVTRVVGDRPWQLRADPEGWKVCLSRPMANADSSRS